MPVARAKGPEMGAAPPESQTPPVFTEAPTAPREPSPFVSPEGWPTEPPVPLDRPLPPPTFRPLRIYAIDSSRGQAPGNIITLKVKYEKLQPGPVGARIKVVDYDAARGCFYDPVDLDDPMIAMTEGVAPSESDPRFHQQMVYAVACDTLRRFEGALGHTIHRRTKDASYDFSLTLYPHGVAQTTAFYSPDGKAAFGYFVAAPEATGRILPGQTVFSCLNYDVVVHVVSHAVVDAVRPDFLLARENKDTMAFLEGFCDLAALLSRFSNRDALIDTIHRTGGVIYRAVLRGDADAETGGPRIQAQITEDNPFLSMAQSFAEAIGKSGGLRSAVIQTDRNALGKITEPHDRGQILLAALFDAFFAIYMKRSHALFRIYRSGGGTLESPDLPHSLAECLADEARWVAERFFSTCARALDYCPPAYLTFGSYLRACITADAVYDPDDPWGVRDALMQAFRGRGIQLEDAAFFSEASLQWPVVRPGRFLGEPELIGLPVPDAAAQAKNQAAIKSFVSANAALFGLRPRTPFDLYPLDTTRWMRADRTSCSMHSTQVIQGEGPSMVGVTLVFDENGSPRHVIPSAGPDAPKRGRRNQRRN